MTTPTPRIPALDDVLPALMADHRARQARLLAGGLAEQRHQIFDLDRDSEYAVPTALTRRLEVAA